MRYDYDFSILPMKYSNMLNNETLVGPNPSSTQSRTKRLNIFNKLLAYIKFLPVQLLTGIAFCTLFPTLIYYIYIESRGSSGLNTINYVMSTTLVFFVIMTLHNVRKFPGIITIRYILPILFFWFILILFSVDLFSSSYSLVFYGSTGSLLVIYLFLINILNRQNELHRFAYIPIGRAESLPTQLPFVNWMRLETPILESTVSAIVTDLHSYDLTKEWEKFIADKTLSGIPVYHHRNLRESLTGRVKINHMYENDLGSLLPSANYMVVKRFLELILIFASLPITLMIIIVTAILIKLESPGPVFFVQQRVGLAGKEFTIYKFRSMTKDSEEHGAKMASQGDMRVTRIGKFIRKVRIDELPQFWNIARGDMSLIGPRPEQKVFVDQFENTIPFYNYRHIVKPGITGWAQVTHGYAADEDETKIKVEHDFYYIKNFSFSLDILIFFKTIFTMLTGFGAR